MIPIILNKSMYEHTLFVKSTDPFTFPDFSIFSSWHIDSLQYIFYQFDSVDKYIFQAPPATVFFKNNL